MALVGNLKEINIATLLQLNCVEKNTVQLTVSTPKGPAMVYLNRGEITDASFAGVRGEEAIYRILSLSEGEFRVAEVTKLPERTITASWQSLLLEGMRVLDETQRGKTRITQTIGNDLSTAPEVEFYVIASKKGEVYATNRQGDAERMAAAAALIAWKGQEVASRLGLGEMSFARLTRGKTLTFFMDCGDLVAVVVAKKAVVSEPVYALVDDVRKKLRYYDLGRVEQGSPVAG